MAITDILPFADIIGICVRIVIGRNEFVLAYSDVIFLPDPPNNYAAFIFIVFEYLVYDALKYQFRFAGLQAVEVLV